MFAAPGLRHEWRSWEMGATIVEELNRLEKTRRGRQTRQQVIRRTSR